MDKDTNGYLQGGLDPAVAAAFSGGKNAKLKGDAERRAQKEAA